jgi:hypothetical protein
MIRHARPARRAATLALVAGLAATSAAAGTPPAGPARPCRLVLGARALGSTYAVRSRLEGAEAIAEDPLTTPEGLPARLARLGKTGGCRVDLVVPVTAKGLQEGPLEVISSASVYDGTAGARAAFAYAARSLVPAGYGSLALGFGLADAAREWVRLGASGYGTMLVYLLLWRDRNVVASLLVVGRVGVVSAGTLEPLARPQELRIRSALA